MIKTLLFLFSKSVFTAGIKKASVLPEPVGDDK